MERLLLTVVALLFGKERKGSGAFWASPLLSGYKMMVGFADYYRLVLVFPLVLGFPFSLLDFWY